MNQTGTQLNSEDKNDSKKMKPRLRWKKNPRPTGSAGWCSGNPGHTLRYGGEECASAYEHNPRHSGKRGWYWVARMDDQVPLYNSCNDDPLTELDAKTAAVSYVRKHIAKL
jgi:hypothetical protein